MKHFKKQSDNVKIVAKTIVISAINFFEGGPLSILMDSIEELSSKKYEKYEIIFFVHDKGLISQKQFPPNIHFIELPKSRQNYLFRLYYEYIFFYIYSKKKNIFLWLSLHDITPNVIAENRVVYCHNPTPFYKNTFRDLFLYPNLFLSSVFYKYLYQINIHKNSHIIVQPYWIKKKFIELFDIEPDKIIVATPIAKQVELLSPSYETDNEVTIFFYPCIPRPFKNIEAISEACKILSENNVNNFKLILTIDGSENNYSKRIYKRFNNVERIQFIGRQTRESVSNIYKISDVLLFPSILETWGLPLTEYKPFQKPIFVSDLPYAKETIGEYEKVDFLDPINPQEWANKMEQIILKIPIKYQSNKAIEVPNPMAKDWEGIFKLLLFGD